MKTTLTLLAAAIAAALYFGLHHPDGGQLEQAAGERRSALSEAAAMINPPTR